MFKAINNIFSCQCSSLIIWDNQTQIITRTINILCPTKQTNSTIKYKPTLCEFFYNSACYLLKWNNAEFRIIMHKRRLVQQKFCICIIMRRYPDAKIRIKICKIRIKICMKVRKLAIYNAYILHTYAEFCILYTSANFKTEFAQTCRIPFGNQRMEFYRSILRCGFDGNPQDIQSS